MTAKTTKIVSMWYDETSDADDARWIVDTDTIEGGESNTIGTHDDEDDAMESARETARKMGVALYTVDSSGRRTEVASAELMAMEALLISNGDRFAGNSATDNAEDWIDNGFDADSAGEWCDIGVWDAATAAEFRDAELTAAEVKAAAESMSEGDDADDYTDGCPIYAACNNDIRASKIIDVANEAK